MLHYLSLQMESGGSKEIALLALLTIYPGDQITNSLAIASWALKMKHATTSMMIMVD
jgi:hypothetical protein